MAEDFVGVSGSLNESFVGAANDKLFEVPFEALEVRMAKEKPQLVPGLTALKKAMSAPAFERLISPLLNITWAMMRCCWLPAMKECARS